MLADIPDTLQTFFAPQVEQLGMDERPVPLGGCATLPEHLGKGYLWVVNIGSHCLLSVHDFTLREPLFLKEYPTEYYALGLMSESVARLALVGPFEAFAENNVLAFHQDEGEIGFTMPERRRCRSTTLCFLPQYFNAAAELVDMDPKAVKSGFLRASPNGFPQSVAACLGAFNLSDCAGNSSMRLAGKALEALSYLVKESKPHAAPSREERLVGEARAIMRESMHKNITLDSLARELFVSRTTLCKAFRAIEGCGAAECLRGMRMERAKELLAQTDLTVAEVASRVGYRHQSSFCDAFKRQCGFTPSALR